MLLCELHDPLHVSWIGSVFALILFGRKVGPLAGWQRTQSIRLLGKIAGRRAWANLYRQLDDFTGIDRTNNMGSGNQLALTTRKRHVLLGSRICHVWNNSSFVR